ncbi:MAG: hybrid sensor histidine kinase/response regulator [Thiobacillus sp.]|nr:hybrid sensor histidine kinase/response regulator [Thiobacillus sp.]
MLAAPGNSPTLSLRLRILIVALLPLLVAVGLFAAYFAHRSTNEAESALTSKGRDSVRRLAEGIAFDLFTGNLPYVKRQMDLERHSIGAQSVAITDGQVWTLLSGAPGPLPDLKQAIPLQQRKERLYFFSHPVNPPTPQESDPYLEPMTKPHVPTAYVVISMTRMPVELTRSQVGLAAAGMAFLSISLALVLAWRLSGVVSEPLHEITRTVGLIAQGNLDERVQQDSPGELGMLQQGINQMASRLEENQRILAQRIEEATAELRAQKAQAESATLAKSRFLAAASHDLRQPLHALSLLVEALQERVPEGEAKRLADHIESSATTMENLLNALLDLSRLEAGVVEARPECFPLARVLDNLERQFAPVASVKGLRLIIHRSKVWVYSDPALLERILANLISNALRYTDTGGVLLGARRVQKDWLRLEVWDTGKGIPAEFQAKVFEEYFQLANPERHRDKGLGLGLAIVARLARLLGSSVQVRSRVDRGSCFDLRFSRCHAQRTDMPKPAARTLGVPLEHALVVFIDDDESILEAMAEVFGQWGVGLAAGEDADQVRRELDELGRKPDVILCDYRLKDGQTGIEAIAILQAAFGPVPAALITGDTAPETIQTLRKSGMPILHKPLKPAKLRAFLSHLLANPVSHIEP